jgi:hypothetical protein
MKPIEAFIKEIGESTELQDAIKDKDALAEFLKKNDIDGTVEDFGKALKSKAEAEGEITDDAAEAVAGGGWLIDPKNTRASFLRGINRAL